MADAGWERLLFDMVDDRYGYLAHVHARRREGWRRFSCPRPKYEGRFDILPGLHCHHHYRPRRIHFRDRVGQ